MKLVYWMYLGPAHIGTLRIVSSFKNMHALMHAPLGDDYFNVMRSMLERERDFTPVTVSTVDRHVLARGSQEKVFSNLVRKEREEDPSLLVLTPTCTSSILQEDLQNFIERAMLASNSAILLADVNHYRINELQALDKTLEQIVRHFCNKKDVPNQDLTDEPSVNIIGPTTLGFHNTHDIQELKRILQSLKIKVNCIIPEGALAQELVNLPRAWVNIVPYREVGLMTAKYLQKEWGTPYINETPMGLIGMGKWLTRLEDTLNSVKPQKQFSFAEFIRKQTFFVSQAAWFSRSIDCQNLTGKRAVVFGDATHAVALTKILTQEMGIYVACCGTYCTHDKQWFMEQVQGLCDEVLITLDHAQVYDMIVRLEPAAIFGSQMERHIGKKLNIPCGVISAPVHIQNFPLGYRPFFGYEGANQIADLVYNSFTLGMEDHLLEMFGGHDTISTNSNLEQELSELEWDDKALAELQQIPGFVRKKVRTNTEKYAKQKGFLTITIDVLYEAKENAASIT